MRRITTLLPLLLSLLLCDSPTTLADDDPNPKGESFTVYHLSAKKADKAYYYFGMRHNKDQSAVYCIGEFDGAHWGEARANCGYDNINIRVQQPDGQDPFSGFNILVNWDQANKGPTTRFEFAPGLQGFEDTSGTSGVSAHFMANMDMDYKG